MYKKMLYINQVQELYVNMLITDHHLNQLAVRIAVLTYIFKVTVHITVYCISKWPSESFTSVFNL